MFKRSLKRRDSSASLNKKHSRVASSVAAPPTRTLTMSAGPSTTNSSCTSLVSSPPPRHTRTSSYAGVFLEPTLEEPLADDREPLVFADEPLFNDSFLSPEAAHDYRDFESLLPSYNTHSYGARTLASSPYTHKFLVLHEVEIVDDDSILSLDEYSSRMPSSIYGDDLATAVYLARPVQKPRMVDVSPPASITRRSSMAPSDTSAPEFGSPSHSRSSSYFARNSYSRNSSFSDPSASDSDETQATASPITPFTPDIAQEEKLTYSDAQATVISIARVSHIRSLSASAPRNLREKTVAARTSHEQARHPYMGPATAHLHRRTISLDTRRPPMPPARISSVFVR